MKSLILTAAALALTATPASADVLYSNFDEDDGYSLTFGMTLSNGTPVGARWEHAVPFIIDGGGLTNSVTDYFFDSAEFAILRNIGPDLFTATLRADDNGKPGAILDSTVVTGSGPPHVWTPPIFADFGGDTILAAGNVYWLALSADTGDQLAGWAYNTVNDFGLRAFQRDGGGWNTALGTPGTDSQRGVYRINGTPVPAPGALAMLALGGSALLRRRRH